MNLDKKNKFDNKICICLQDIGILGASMISVLSFIKDKKSKKYMYDVIGIGNTSNLVIDHIKLFLYKYNPDYIKKFNDINYQVSISFNEK